MSFFRSFSLACRKEKESRKGKTEEKPYRHSQRPLDRGFVRKRHKAKSSRHAFLPQDDTVLDLSKGREVGAEDVVVDLSRAADKELAAQGGGGGGGGRCRYGGGGCSGNGCGRVGGSGRVAVARGARDLFASRCCSCCVRGNCCRTSRGSRSSDSGCGIRAGHRGLGVDALAVEKVGSVLRKKFFGFF